VDAAGLSDSSQAGRSGSVPAQEWSNAFLWFALASVCFVYALPNLLSLAQTGKILPIFRPDEPIYMVRTAAAMRGDTLGNPYIAGHEHAPRFMPELSERLVGKAGRSLHLDIVNIAAAFRVLQPAAIFLGVVWICRVFGFPPALAALAGVLTVLAPSLGMMRMHRPGWPPFLRYARFLSAGFHTTLFVAALGTVAVCWQRPTRWRVILAALAVGAIFYTPIFYWGVLWVGLMGLVLVSEGEQRRAAVMIAALSAVIAIPMAITAIRNGSDPAVLETLHRWPTWSMLPGRGIEDGVRAHLALCTGSAFLAWMLRRRSKVFLFLLAFFAATVPLLLENVVTNQKIQAYHFTDALNPLWAILGAALITQFRINKVVIASAFALLIGFGVTEQLVDYVRLRIAVAEHSEAWAPNWRIPRTLAWLQKNTPSDSVVMAALPVMQILPIFTHNKVYSSESARQHVMPTEEADRRFSEAKRWAPGEPLTYRVDFYLVTEATACAEVPRASLAFRDPLERTCVWQRRRD
jgi:hypothetical protein